MAESKMTPARFRTLVWRYYRAHGRHDLPWRKTNDPYRILVSEVMLQQTQVDRVIPFYKNFIKQFPTAKKLAAAPLSDVLVAWQGLGYNRRAKMLHQAAKDLASIGKVNFPILVVELEKLPGVGPYTARAVVAFSYNLDVVVIETNIRTAIIHHFFPKKKKVSDAEIEKILRQALPTGSAREWYSALMDYGAYLKRSGISHNAKNKDYTKQLKFAGSLREVRGAILRELSKKEMLHSHLENILGRERKEQMGEAIRDLLKEGLIEMKRNIYTLAN